MTHLLPAPSSKRLGQKLLKSSNVFLYPYQQTIFADGEYNIQNVSQTKVDELFVLQSIFHPIGQSLLELLLFANAGSAHTFTAIIPYLGYSRSKTNTQLIFDLLATRFDRLICLDLHDCSLLHTAPLLIEHLTPLEIFLPELDTIDPLIIAPDIGALPRAQRFAAALDTEMVLINKRSNDRTLCSKIKHRNCLIVDDILASGDTLLRTTEFLNTHGASHIEACITHALFNRDIQKKIQESALNHLWISDSIPHNQNIIFCPKIQVVSTCAVFTQAMNRSKLS